MKRRIRRKPPVDRAAAEAWMRAARGKPCANCGRKAGLIRGHHIIDQQALRRLATDGGLDYERLRWDMRNMLPLCDECHERHHSRARVIALSVVTRWTPSVIAFAEVLDMGYLDGRTPAAMYLEREYA